MRCEMNKSIALNSCDNINLAMANFLIVKEKITRHLI